MKLAYTFIESIMEESFTGGPHLRIEEKIHFPYLFTNIKIWG